jgi:glycerophosphoryl diester phosphodiesterase
MRATLGLFFLAAAVTVVPAMSTAATAAVASCATTPAIAHRGITTAHTENTLGSVRAAVDADAPFEVDLRSTADDKVVVMHDTTIDRTTTGTGVVAQMTAEEIRAFRAADGQEIPLVEDVLALLAAAPGTDAYLELKLVSEPAMTLLSEAVVAHGVTDQVTVNSFSAQQLESFQNLLPTVPAYMIHRDLPTPASMIYNASVYTTLMTQAWVDAVRARGLVFRARHDDGPGRYRTWDLGLEYGVTAFMTDRLSNYRAYCVGKLRQPDALVSRSSTDGYLGNDVYNTTGAGQTLRSTARRTFTRTFFVRLSNDGTEPATYTVRGSEARPRSRVRYWFAGNDITSGVLSASGWRTDLDAGSSKGVRVTVTVLRRAAIGTTKSAMMTQSWRGEVPRSDTVRAEVRVVR